MGGKGVQAVDQKRHVAKAEILFLDGVVHAPPHTGGRYNGNYFPRA
jgi:hypothetical protein